MGQFIQITILDNNNTHLYKSIQVIFDFSFYLFKCLLPLFKTYPPLIKKKLTN